MRETYRRIDRGNINPAIAARQILADREMYLLHRQILDDMRKAYLRGHITKDELVALREQIKAGDAAGAKKGLMRLLERSGAYV